MRAWHTDAVRPTRSCGGSESEDPDHFDREAPSRTSLSSVQDVVGLRLVGPLNLREQDGLAARIVESFPDSKLVDRRKTPMYGYRAVHVIPRHQGVPVEVQVRTRYQHVWADATERLADAWGRGIRYGLPPEGRDPGEVAERTQALDKWLLVAGHIAALEQETIDLTEAMSQRLLAALKADPGVDPERLARELLANDPALTRGTDAAAAAMNRALKEGGFELSKTMAESFSKLDQQRESVESQQQ